MPPTDVPEPKCCLSHVMQGFFSKPIMFFLAKEGCYIRFLQNIKQRFIAAFVFMVDLS